MRNLIRLGFACSLLAAVACSSSSSSSGSETATDFAGSYVFESGDIEIDCPDTQPIVYDLAHEAMGNPGSFTDTATGKMTFHHVDINNCQFDFTVSGGVASASPGSCQVPDGSGGMTTYQVTTLEFQPMSGAAALWVDGAGTIGGCPMTIEGLAAKH